LKTLDKKILISTALIMLMVFAAVMQTTNAAVRIRTPYETFAYLSAVPTPIGVGQTAVVTFRVDQPLAGATIRSGLANGTTVTVTKPDGTTENKGPFIMDATSSGWMLYTPTQTGTYYFQMHFPQQAYWINGTTNQDYYVYKASDSQKIPLVVQTDPILPYDRSPPLPTDYWTRPINAENKGWWAVADNWLMRGYDLMGRSFAGSPAFAPYTSGPDSPHVLWKKAIIPGGMVGGIQGDRTYYTGISYEQFFEAMILQGTVFYGEHGLTSSSPTIGTRFMDLYTGQDYPMMYMVNTSVAFAMAMNYDSGNEHGVLPYLVITSGSNWLFYEMLPDMQQPPVLRFTLANMTGLTGTTFFGPQGEVLSINIGGNSTHRYMTMFNVTRAALGINYGSGLDVWSPSGTINAARALNQGPGGVSTADLARAEAASNSKIMGIEWNVTLPDVDGVSQTVRLINYQDGQLLATATDSSNFPYVYSDVGYNIGLMKPDSSGNYPDTLNHLFAANRTMIHDIHDRTSTQIMDGTFVRFDEGEEVYYGFDILTGAQKWATTPLNNAWAMFTRTYELAYGKLITSGFDGIIRAFDLKDGKLLWAYDKGSAGFENAYGGYPEYAGLAIADRTVYTTADEHSSDGVLWRGSQLWAIDIDTGKLDWKVNGMYRHPIVSDGIVVALNSYDGQVYAFGKGPSKTTVSAPQLAVTKGTSLVITGSVTDQTPASKDTPAISDASMGQWMEYIHMQKTIPGNATGVQVMLTAIDPNGNNVNIGTATTDLAGNFGFTWSPVNEGNYQIMATFAGSNSYGSSFATTYMAVSPAAATPAPTETLAPTVAPTVAPTATASPSPVPNTGSGLGTEVYIAIAAAAVIAIVGAAALILRKRK
jgi:hypothetical protein